MPVTINGTAGVTFNDSSTQSTAAVVNTTSVLNATAAASLGAVGTYAFLYNTTTATTNAGETRAGSTLFYANAGAGNPTPAASGTWRCMGRTIYDVYETATFYRVTVWLRIS